MRSHIALITLVTGTTFAAPAVKRNAEEDIDIERRNLIGAVGTLLNGQGGAVSTLLGHVSGALSTAVAQQSGVISTATSEILDPTWVSQGLGLSTLSILPTTLPSVGAVSNLAASLTKVQHSSVTLPSVVVPTSAAASLISKAAAVPSDAASVVSSILSAHTSVNNPVAGALSSLASKVTVLPSGVASAVSSLIKGVPTSSSAIPVTSNKVSTLSIPSISLGAAALASASVKASTASSHTTTKTYPPVSAFVSVPKTAVSPISSGTKSSSSSSSSAVSAVTKAATTGAMELPGASISFCGAVLHCDVSSSTHTVSHTATVTVTSTLKLTLPTLLAPVLNIFGANGARLY